MTVALYCRVSSDEQAKEGFSLDAQQEMLIAYCKVHGWKDYKLYIDDGYTGSNMQRPGLQKLLYDIKKKKITQVVIMKLDRLSRSQKDTLYLIEDVFLPNDIGFHSAKETIDTTTPVGKLMIGILSSFAQFERETLIERVTMGRRQRIRKGLWYGGRIPFGYEWDKDNQKLVINREQAMIVKEIYKRFLQGQSYNSISEWAAMRTNAIFIDHTRVREILTRPVYTGRLNSIGTLVEGNHDAIIDVEMWESVQKKIQKRRESKTSNGKYLLSGLLECGVCGGIMFHIKSERRGYCYHYYVCKANHVRPKNASIPSCKMKRIRQEKLESDVISALHDIALNPEIIKQEILANRAEQPEQIVTEDLSKQLDEVEQKLNNLYDALENESLDSGRIQKRISTLEDEKKRILFRLDELDTPVNDSTFIYESLQIITQAWEYMSLEEKQAVLKNALRKIIVHPDGEFTLVWND